LFDRAIGKQATEYLTGRSLDKTSIDKFSLGFSPEGFPSLKDGAAKVGISETLLIAADLRRAGEDGRVYDTFRNRLMFPIRDSSAQVVGFGGRTLGDHPAKYINTRQTPLFEKGNGLYGLDIARSAIVEHGQCVLVEGYMDCIAAHQAGFSQTVATLGTALTDAQITLIRRFSDDVILLFDSDRAGEEAADRAIRLAIPKGLRVRMARIPEGKDPSDFLNRQGTEAFRDVLKEAVDALEFKWNQTRARFGSGETNARRGEAVLDFVRIVATACEAGSVDVIQRGLLVNQVAHLLRMDSNEVRKLIRQQTPRPQGGPPLEKAVAGSGNRLGREDEEQAAWGHLLGAVLNEPGLLGAANGKLDVTRIRNEVDRRVAERVLELFGRVGDFRLADLLAVCHDPGELTRVMALSEQGAARANYEATFQLALARVVRRSGSILPGNGPSVSDESTGDPESRESLQAFSDAVRTHRHFAPRRMIRPVRSEAVGKTE
jgi:DNA primase